jgi:hypothetical protein
MQARPGIVTNRVIGAPPDQLLVSHEKMLVERYGDNPPRTIDSVEAMEEVWNQGEQASFDFNLTLHGPGPVQRPGDA